MSLVTSALSRSWRERYYFQKTVKKSVSPN